MAAAQIIWSGTLTITPTSVVGASPGGGFPIPGGTDQEPVLLQPNPKPSAVRAIGNKRNASALGTYVALSGVGSTDNVQTADFLYVVTDAPMVLRLTMQDLVAGTGTTQQLVQVEGPQVFNFPVRGYLVGIEASGAGNIAYLASGPQ